MDDQLDLLRALMKLEPRVHIFGGYAEDALLHGRVTRDHEDVDVVVFRDELSLRVEQARALGFEEFYVRMDAWHGHPLVIGCVVGDMNLEYVIFDRDADGNVSFDIPNARGVKRVWMPADMLDHPPTTLEEIAVRTVSPVALYQIRAGAEETFGGFRTKDQVSQAALRRRFFAGQPEAGLLPRMEVLSAPVAHR